MVKTNKNNIKQSVVYYDNVGLCIATDLVMKDFGVTRLEALSIITSNQEEILTADFGIRIMYVMFKKKSNELK